MPDESLLPPPGPDLAAAPEHPAPRPLAGELIDALRLAARERLDTWRVGWSRRRVAIVVAAVVAVGVAGWFIAARPAPVPVEDVLPRAVPAGLPVTSSPSAVATGAAPSAAPSAPSSTVAPALVVDVRGAVRRPGLVRLRAGDRVEAALAAAGGAAPGADLDRLNLAALVADGERVYVPLVGQVSIPLAVNGDGSGGAGAPAPGSSEPADSGPVDLNRASADQLDALPGVGPATAAAIVAYRTAHGPFRRVDDLLEVRGIGPAKLEAMRAQVRV